MTAKKQQVHLRPALQVNDPALVHSSTAASLGIGVLPEFLCRQGLAMGKLERVLPDWSVASPLQLQAVYPAHLAGSAGDPPVHRVPAGKHGAGARCEPPSG